MKTKELISILERAGFKQIRAQKHYIYNNGTLSVIIPRHKEVNKYTAKDILRKACIAS